MSKLITPETKKCEGCGKEFTTNNSLKKYHSSRCQVNSWMKRNPRIKEKDFERAFSEEEK